MEAREMSKVMCDTCGCGNPDDDHGDGDGDKK